MPNWLVTCTVGVGWADGGLMLKHARWAFGLVILKTCPVGRIFSTGLQWTTAGLTMAGTKPFGLNWSISRTPDGILKFGPEAV